MSKIARTAVLSLAGAVGVGMVTIGAGAANAGTDPALLSKRELSSAVWMVDDDGDDLNKDDDTNTGDNTYSRSARSNDATNSRYSAVSRDRDRSWGDRTRDWTRDGGDRTRDFSRNLTNDKSRNDTRRG